MQDVEKYKAHVRLEDDDWRIKMARFARDNRVKIRKAAFSFITEREISSSGNHGNDFLVSWYFDLNNPWRPLAGVQSILPPNTFSWECLAKRY